MATGALSNPISCVIGENSIGLHLYKNYLVIISVGGMQNAGHTNGRLSKLSIVPAFEGSFGDPDVPITGDDMGQTFNANSSFDIFDIAFSLDGSNAYLLTLTYEQDSRSDDYLACWRVYKISSMDDLISWTLKNENESLTISKAVAAGLLTECDSAFGVFSGYYFNIDYQDAGDGKLWFLNGNICVSAGSNYDDPDAKFIGDPIYGPGAVELNSSGLACDLLYPPDVTAGPKSSHKARHRTLARSVKAAIKAARQAGGRAGGGAEEDREER